MNITLAQADTIIAAAKVKAVELGTKMNICIVDTGANMVAFARMDGAWLGSTDISLKKAKTSAFFDMDTAVLTPITQPNTPLFNIEHSNGGLITFPGGVVIRDANGVMIGAIGVSGSTVDNDHTVAVTGAKTL